MDLVLVAGLWLDGSAWDAVVPGLEARGHRAIAVTLPGQGDGNRQATLAEQAATVVAAVDATSGGAVVVGHSAAASLAWGAADARPERVRTAVIIGGFPAGDGATYFPDGEIVDDALPFPGWEPFEGPDSADLTREQKQRFQAGAIPVPEGVARGTVELGDERRYDVPVTLLCPEFSTDQAREWIEGGAVPELARARHLSLVNLDTGHWPMLSAPSELAAVLAGIADQLQT